MNAALNILTPQRVATETFTDATSAIGRLEEIYERNTRILRDRFEAYVNGAPPAMRPSLHCRSFDAARWR